MNNVPKFKVGDKVIIHPKSDQDSWHAFLCYVGGTTSLYGIVVGIESDGNLLVECEDSLVERWNQNELVTELFGKL